MEGCLSLLRKLKSLESLIDEDTIVYKKTIKDIEKELEIIDGLFKSSERIKKQREYSEAVYLIVTDFLESLRELEIYNYIYDYSFFNNEIIVKFIKLGINIVDTEDIEDIVDLEELIEKDMGSIDENPYVAIDLVRKLIDIIKEVDNFSVFDERGQDRIDECKDIIISYINKLLDEDIEIKTPKILKLREIAKGFINIKDNNLILYECLGKKDKRAMAIGIKKIVESEIEYINYINEKIESCLKNDENAEVNIYIFNDIRKYFNDEDNVFKEIIEKIIDQVDEIEDYEEFEELIERGEYKKKSDREKARMARRNKEGITIGKAKREDRIEKVIKLKEQGMSYKSIANRLNISESSVRRYLSKDKSKIN